ncbi:hypothetical protein TRFO_41235 [Tritrichomonas foetus]|uniref:Uncharacterized protein n=1 Tax=Tritrichomonas foetus TaxID=1144522 RepID=A0A1J4L167_9EUKA|nr:hypothetical protein TRFO_41235 [Tritrichomonas foetus]|eukprot:OHT17179.1 hypothetical protein TRFO_41235 [Tritrichomonas foetus]
MKKLKIDLVKQNFGHSFLLIMEPAIFYSTLLSFCKEQSESEPESSKESLDFKLVWSTIFDIAKKDPIHLPVFFSLVKQYSLIVNEFQNFAAPEIDEAISSALNESDFTSKLQSITPIIYLISILPLDKCLKTYNLIIDLFAILEKQNLEFPNELTKILENTECSTMNEETLECFFDIVKDNLETERCSASILAFSYFVKSTIEALSDSTSTICEWSIKCLKSTSNNQIAALFMLQKAAEGLSYNLDVIPKDLLDSVLPLLISNDQNIQIRANKAMRHLISSQVFYSQNAIDAIIGQYSHYPEDKVYILFILLERFLDNNETPIIGVIQQIFDFAMNSISQVKIPFVKAKCIECLSEIGSISEAYIEGILDEAFVAAISLFSDKKSYTEISNFLMMISQSFPQYKTNIIDEKLPLLVDSILDEESGTKKQRLERAESLSGIIQNRQNKELSEKIINFTVDSLNSIVGGEIIYICALILAIRDQLSEETAHLIFQKLETFARKEIDTIRLNAILHTMKKLMKHFSFDPKSFVLAIMNGEIDYLGGLPVYTCKDDKTMLFFFIATYVRKFSQNSVEICTKIIDCVPNVNYKMLPAVLEPLEAGISTEIFSKEDIAKISSVVIETLDKLLLDDEDEVIACIEIMSIVAKKAFDVIDLNKIYNILKQLLESVQEGEEMPPLGSIIRFIFELSTTQISDNNIDNDLITAAVKMLPLSPHIGSMTGIMKILTADILSNSDKFGFLSVDGLTAIAELLISQDLGDYEFPQELINEMKALLKKMVRADRNLERQISKHFQSSRQKQNRFSRLLK